MGHSSGILKCQQNPEYIIEIIIIESTDYLNFIGTVLSIHRLRWSEIYRPLIGPDHGSLDRILQNCYLLDTGQGNLFKDLRI